MLRYATPDDTPALLALTERTGFFKPLEVEALREVLDDYHAANHAFDHQARVWEEADGTIGGYVYFAPAAMTDRTWYLYWIAVEKGQQRRGLGGVLLRGVEDNVRARGGRLLLVETSSTDHYDPTRKFYLKHGYDQAATIPDYYADGDGMVVFHKRLVE